MFKKIIDAVTEAKKLGCGSVQFLEDAEYEKDVVNITYHKKNRDITYKSLVVRVDDIKPYLTTRFVTGGIFFSENYKTPNQKNGVEWKWMFI